ncbi:hypothetical protein [Fibrisoma montanum]|nr:hypothetical protein [Fibrisoma montanum]
MKLNHSELVALNSHLYLTLTSQPIEELRRYPADFVINSNVAEVYQRTNRMVEDARMFPSKTDKIYSLSLTRSQAIAVLCTIMTEQTIDTGQSATMDLLPFSDDSYEAAILQQIVSTIHQTYLV